MFPLFSAAKSVIVKGGIVHK